MEESQKCNLGNIIAYLESTPEDSWCTDVVKTKDGRNCVMGHIFDYGGGDLGGSDFWDFFEACIATTFMIYGVNDGKDSDYQQPTPKQRCIAYLRDIEQGVKPSTQRLMEQQREL